MTNNEIVSSNFDLIKTCCMHQSLKYDTPSEFLDDIIQEVSLILLEYPNDKLNKIVEENHLNAFISGVLVKQLYSTNSSFYRTYRRFRENSNPVSENDKAAEPKVKIKKEKPAEKIPYYPEDYDPSDDDSDELAKLKESLRELSPGERNIFLTYCENPNISSFARELKVSPQLLKNYLNPIKNKLKACYSQDY